MQEPMDKYLLEYQKADVVPLPNLVKLDYIRMVLHIYKVVRKTIQSGVLDEYSGHQSGGRS